MRKKRGLVLLLTLLVMVMAFPVMAQAAVKISRTKLNMMSGETYKLKITGTSKTVKWSSSKTSVATVSSSGKVTAKKSGTATIKAKVNNKTYKCKVTVKSYSGIYYVQAGVFGKQVNLARTFLRVRDYVSDAYFKVNNGTYTIIAGTFYNYQNARNRRNYLIRNGIDAEIEMW